MDKPSHSFDRRGAAPLFSIALVLLLAAACLFGIPARAAAVCTPLGGAPGPMPGLGAETGQGAIGPGTSPIGGRSPGEVVSELVGASSPPACQASGSSA